MFSGGTAFRTPSYFPLWSQKRRKRVTSAHKDSPGMNSLQDQELGGGDNCEAPTLKMNSPRSGKAAADNHSMDTRVSAASGGDSGGTAASAVTISPRHKDPDRIKKDREREERVRQARERLEEERKKKLLELQDQQRQAQENREKQLEMRRKKIEDLRRREMERRAEVERRRREKETAEKSRRESLLLKAEERVARYEAWKRGGQKGGRGHVLGFGSATPRAICRPAERPRRSSSHSGLLRHSPSGSDSEYSFRPQRRALSACSTVRRHCCVDLNRSGPPPGSTMPAGKHLSVSTSVLYHKRHSDFSSSGALNVPNRPDSLLDRSRPRGAVSASRAENKEEEEEKKSSDKPGVKISRKTLERLSTPRQTPTVGDGDRKDSSSTPRREPNLVRTSPRKAYSTSNLAMPRQKSSSFRERSTTKEVSAKSQTPKETAVKPKAKEAPAKTTPQATKRTSSPAPASSSTPRATSPASHTPMRVLSPAPGADEDGGSSTTTQSWSTPIPMEKPTIEVTEPQPPTTPTPVEMPPTVDAGQVQSTPTAVERSMEESTTTTTTTPSEKSTADITAEEYKARLAEKRRQAREKAEREAEEERKRKEEEERLEAERRRQEEEEEKRREEEAVRLAEEARRAEEQRLQKAIEVEEARRAEEAARLEQERLAKEEADRKAKEEAERLEREKQEKARREEEERLERKKRLEMIMKRVKTDNTAEVAKDSPRSVSSSPARNVTAAAPVENPLSEPDSRATLTTPTLPAVASLAEERKRSMDSNTEGSQSPASGAMSPANAPSPVPFPAQETSSSISQSSSQENMLEVREESTPTSSRSESPVVSALRGQGSGAESSADSKPRFKSPLLQKLVEGKDDAGSSPGDGGPRFKSPLLQNILSKTRVGARMGLTQDYSQSSPDLSRMEGSTSSRDSNASPSAMAMSSSMIDMDTVNSASKEELNKNEEKDVDTSEDTSSSSHSSPSHQSRKTVVSNGEGVHVAQSVASSQDVGSTPTETSTAPGDLMTTSSASEWNAQDSGVSLGSAEVYSLTPALSLQLSLNGHDSEDMTQGHGLEDSSISMQSVDSLTPALTDSATGSMPPTGSLCQEHSAEDKNFEELIDLSITGTSNNSTTSSLLNKSPEDFVNFSKLEEGSEGSGCLPPPIIAFEETSKMKHQDVSDLLS
ncbi:uncharacterized protein LOC143297908 isoform X9 [Babylonia areolata]|uniref:uncharacterized protein LOC143297908 isoform X9 n=1 Tax=Babylonia areolata TaxID=304850 RepID=UPI003FD101C3